MTPYHGKYTTTVEEKYVRLVSPNGQDASVWIARAEDVAGLTPAQLKEKFALPKIPERIVDVTIPAGTRMRTGTAGQNVFGGGGGRQFEIMVDRKDLSTSWFTNPRKL